MGCLLKSRVGSSHRNGLRYKAEACKGAPGFGIVQVLFFFSVLSRTTALGLCATTMADTRVAAKLRAALGMDDVSDFLAALKDPYPQFRKGGTASLAKTEAALKGWRKLDPARARLPIVYDTVVGQFGLYDDHQLLQQQQQPWIMSLPMAMLLAGMLWFLLHALCKKGSKAGEAKGEAGEEGEVAASDAAAAGGRGKGRGKKSEGSGCKTRSSLRVPGRD